MKIVYCHPIPDDVTLPLRIVEWTRDRWYVLDAGNYNKFRPMHELAEVIGVKDLLESERATLKTTLPLIVMAKLTGDNYEL